MGSDFHALIGNCIGGLGFLGLAITLFVRSRAQENNVTVLPTKLVLRPEQNAETELRALLSQGAQRLGLPYAAFIHFEKNRKAQVQELISTRYSEFAPLKKGEILETGNLYCERFLRGVDLLAIDYASLSSWREHEGFKASGIETYLGVAIHCQEQVIGSLSFFDEQARDHFFTSSEKEFVRGLGSKLSAMLTKSSAELSIASDLSVASTASLSSEIL